MNETADMMRRLEALRKKLDDAKADYNRLSGELAGHKNRLAELEEKCKADFDCALDELPGVAADMKAEAERLLLEAEKVLAPDNQGVN